MNARIATSFFALTLAALFAGCASMIGTSQAKVTLTGAEEVPPVTTAGSGQALFTVERNWSIAGKVTTTGVSATAAHIHEGRRGTNGPVVIPLRRTGDNEWSVPPDTRLTDRQFQSYRDGLLYVNVHSAAHPGGEIRGQLTP